MVEDEGVVMLVGVMMVMMIGIIVEVLVVIVMIVMIVGVEVLVVIGIVEGGDVLIYCCRKYFGVWSGE